MSKPLADASLFIVTLVLGASLANSANSENTSMRPLPNQNIVSQHLQTNPSVYSFKKLPHGETQKIIDWGFHELLATPTGQLILSKLFECDVNAVSQHLGLSSGFDISSLGRCEVSSSEISKYIQTDPADSIRYDSNFSSRKYEIQIFPKSGAPLVDSWTDQETKVTFIFAPQGSSLFEFKSLILKALAHETATYLDAKKNITEIRIKRSAVFSQLTIDSALTGSRTGQLDYRRLYTAMQNPVIQYVTGFIRAFKVEKDWIREVAIGTDSPALASEYEHPNFSFLRDCSNECIDAFVKLNSKFYSQFALPLLLDGTYWQNKGKELESANTGIMTDRKSQALQVLYNDREDFASRMGLKDYFFGIQDQDTSTQRLLKNARVAFDTFSTPSDLSTLLAFNVKTQLGETSQTLLSWLATPLLSNTGIKWSSGPRPRIRTNMGSASSPPLIPIVNIGEITPDWKSGSTPDQTSSANKLKD